MLGVAAAWSLYASIATDFVDVGEVIPTDGANLTQVYDRRGPTDGVLLGTLVNEQAPLQRPVPLSSISPSMIAATIATEDDQFWNHPGIDPIGLARALSENLRAGDFGAGSGGSTITQQLVKNLYLSTDCAINDGVRQCVAPRTVSRKLRELVYALELEKRATKDDILALYLNQVSYADRYVGVEAAARGYFRKPAAQLTLPEAALLAGIPASPTEYHPRLNCVRIPGDVVCQRDDQGRWLVGGAAKERQEQVLGLMVRHGQIDRPAAAQASREPVYVYAGVDEARAPAWVDGQVEPRLVRMCEAGLLPLQPGTGDCEASVHSAGYRVTTTLDWELTAAAAEIAAAGIEEGLAQGCDCHNAAVVTIDPVSGEILVYVPGLQGDESDPRVAPAIDQLTEINQPGSSLKPVIYLAWFDLLAKTPASTLWDTSPMTLDEEDGLVGVEVEIRNPRPGGGGEGLITARVALGGSQNVPALRAAQEVSIEGVIQTAKRLGITTLEQGFDPTFRSHASVYYGPTIATGGSNIRAIDTAYANATIANMGVMVGVPHLAKTIEPGELEDLAGSTGAGYERALAQRRAFTRGDLRLPGTRELDPVVVLRVEGADGRVLFEQGEPARREVVNRGSVWLLHSILSDCEARYIIWQCGSNNEDTMLDVFLDGVRIPGGVKSGTQQGPLSATDTLETWMTGYSRYGATVVWVGNANNALVVDGPAGGYISGRTTLRIYKRAVSTYHEVLRARGRFQSPAGFEDLQPANVVFDAFRSPATERGRPGGCYQQVKTWLRTDVTYEPECENGLVALPEFKRDEAIALARRRGIVTAYSLPPTETPTPEATAQGSPSPSSTGSPPLTPTPSPAIPRATPSPAVTPQPTPNPVTGAPAAAP